MKRENRLALTAVVLMALLAATSWGLVACKPEPVEERGFGQYGSIQIVGGDLKIGDAAPSTTLNGEDAFVEGTFEVDGAVDLDGALAVAGAATLASSLQAASVTATGAASAASLSVSGEASVADLTASDDITATDDLIANDLSVTDWLQIDAQTAISVTAGAIITPTGTYQPLESASAVTCSTSTCVADGATAGDLLILINTNASDAITIDGTGANVECASDIAMAAGETITLLWDGTDWQCLANFDKS